MIEFHSTAEGLSFWVLVQPRSSQTAITGHHQNALKIKLTAPPVEGAANQQCIELLAKTLNRPKSTITITNGQTARRKQILIQAKAGPLPQLETQDLINKLEKFAQGEK